MGMKFIKLSPSCALHDVLAGVPVDPGTGHAEDLGIVSSLVFEYNEQCPQNRSLSTNHSQKNLYQIHLQNPLNPNHYSSFPSLYSKPHSKPQLSFPPYHREHATF